MSYEDVGDPPDGAGLAEWSMDAIAALCVLNGGSIRIAIPEAVSEGLGFFLMADAEPGVIQFRLRGGGERVH
jgi:hypothetical protein